MRRAAKVDDTHAAIRDALRAAGCSVFDASRLGDSFPDLVCAYRGYCALIEAKTGKRKPNPRQDRFAREWQGAVIVANSPELAVSEFFKAWATSCINGAWR